MKTVACVLALALAGCAGSAGPDPSPGASTHRSHGPVAQAERTHEYSAPHRPSARSATAGATTAAAAIRAFATAYINWSYITIAADLRGLARSSVGEARSAMTLAAAQTAHDYELQRGRVSNHGTVEVVAPRAGHRDQYVVVTEELTTAAATAAYDGLQPAWHVALATVARQPDGRFAVSAWEPQS